MRKLVVLLVLISVAFLGKAQTQVDVSLNDVQEYMHKLVEVFLPTYHVVELNSPVNIIRVIDGEPVLETIRHWVVEALTPYEDDLNKLQALGDSSYMDLQGGLYTSYLMIDSTNYVPPSAQGLEQFMKEKQNIPDTTDINLVFKFE